MHVHISCAGNVEDRAGRGELRQHGASGGGSVLYGYMLAVTRFHDP